MKHEATAIILACRDADVEWKMGVVGYEQAKRIAKFEGMFLMSPALTYPHIEKTGQQPARLRRLPRICVSQIVTDYLNHGWSADEIVLHYPHLRPAEVHSAMAYYFDHQEEIDGEINEEQRLIEEWRRTAPPTPAELRLRAQGRLPRPQQAADGP